MGVDRKSTRLNSSHGYISYAVFCYPRDLHSFPTRRSSDLVFWRAWHEPLAGPDIEFRWSFLAEQMLRLGTLDFYPPRSAGDFFSYFWVESIPPGVAALHAWA